MKSKTVHLLTVLLIVEGGHTSATGGIKVVDADPQNVVRLVTSTIAGSFRLPLEADEAPATNLTVEIDDFTSTNGLRVRPQVTLNGKAAGVPINVSMSERPVVEFAASFPGLGEYKSHLVLFYSGKPHDLPIIVVRQQNELGFQLDGVDTVSVTKWWSADAHIYFTVRETAGQRAALYAPTLENFALKEVDKLRKQVGIEEIKLDGQGITGDSLTKAPVESYFVEPYSSRTSIFEVKGIPEAGEYIGSIRASGPNRVSVSREITILVKNSVWIAAFWVFVGVSASILIRIYIKEQRPKLVAWRRLSYALDALEEAKVAAGNVAEAHDVCNGLRTQLDKIERGLKDGDTQNAVDALKEVETRIRVLPDWINTGRNLSAVAASEIVDSPRADWTALARSYFLTTGTAVDIGLALAKIENEILVAIIGRITEFTAKVESYRVAHPQVGVGIDQVLAELKAAKGMAKLEGLTLMSDHFRKARLVFAKILVRDFITILADPTPWGFAGTEWEDLKREITARVNAIQQATEPSEVEEIYQEINHGYFVAVVSKLKGVIDRLAATAQDSAEGDKIKIASKAVTEAQSAIDAEEWDKAGARYGEAASVLANIISARALLSGQQQGADEAGHAPANFTDVLPIGFAIQRGFIPRQKRSKAERFTVLLDRYDTILNVALAVIACVVGVNMLWLNDPTWGGWKAYTTALLWGLGLHQVGGSTLDGLQAVVKKLEE